MNRFSIYITLCWMFCLSGLVGQVYYIADDYFSYETVTQVLISRLDNITTPAVSMCLKVEHMEKFSKVYEGPHITSRLLLDNSTSTDDFFIGFRRHAMDNYYELNQPRNSTEFNLFKYIKQRNICYSVSLLKEIRFDTYVI